MKKYRECPACGGKRFIDGFNRGELKRSLLCPVCKGDGCVSALVNSDVIAFGKQFEALKRRDNQ